jgi:hypothetical protein
LPPAPPSLRSQNTNFNRELRAILDEALQIASVWENYQRDRRSE